MITFGFKVSVVLTATERLGLSFSTDPLLQSAKMKLSGFCKYFPTALAGPCCAIMEAVGVSSMFFRMELTNPFMSRFQLLRELTTEIFVMPVLISEIN